MYLNDYTTFHLVTSFIYVSIKTTEDFIAQKTGWQEGVCVCVSVNWPSGTPFVFNDLSTSKDVYLGVRTTSGRPKVFHI